MYVCKNNINKSYLMIQKMIEWAKNNKHHFQKQKKSL